MADAFIYERGTKDFSTLGLCGRLCDSSCVFEEEANGMSEITMEHPIDPEGRFLLLTPGRIIKAVVPVRNVPELNETQDFVKVLERWYVRSDATRVQRTIFNKRDDQVQAQQAALRAEQQAERKAAEDAGEKYDSEGDSEEIEALEKKKLKLMKKGARVTVVMDYGDDIPEVKVRTGKITGYMDKTALRDKVTVSTAATTAQKISDFYEREIPSWQAKEQLFRIYAVERSDESVTVHARHIFYDLLYTITRYDVKGSHSLMAMVNGIKNQKVGACPINFYSNIKGSRVAGHYLNQSIIEALLDPEEGVLARWNADLIRDNYDAYLLDDAGYRRGTTLYYRHDLMGVEYSIDWDDVVTAIRPVGETKSGKPLYLSGNKGLVKSPHIADYPNTRVAVLEVPEAKVGDDMTTSEARAKLKAAAQREFANGADQPKISVKVDFIHLGDTEEYAAYHELKQVFLFDTVGILHSRLGINTLSQVVKITWDCKLERMQAIELGSIRDYTPSISGFQIAGGINGNKIMSETVTAAALTDGAVEARHIQANSINADMIQSNAIVARHILAGEITATHIATGSITADRLDAQAVNTKLLVALNAVIQQLDAGHAEVQTLEAGFAAIQVLEAGSATFDRTTVQHLVANALNLTFGTGTDVFIQNLRVAYAQMVSATIGNLCIKASDGNYYNIDVSQAGLVTATPATVTPSEADAGQTSGGRTILDTDIVAANLSTSTLLGTFALVNAIDASRIDVDRLTARQAFIDQLAAREIIGERTIRMIAGQARQAGDIGRVERVFRDEPEPPYDAGDLWIQGAGELLVCATAKADGESFDADDWQPQTAYDAALATMREEVSAMVEVDTDGLHIKGAQLEDGELVETLNEVVVTPEAMNVVVNQETYSRFAANYAQFGNYQMRRTSDGGLAFVMV